MTRQFHGANALPSTSETYTWTGVLTAPTTGAYDLKVQNVKRLVLTPGQSQQVTIHVGARELSSWSTIVHDWVRNSGVPTVYVGSSSRDLRLMTSPIFTYVFLPLVTR